MRLALILKCAQEGKRLDHRLATCRREERDGAQQRRQELTDLAVAAEEVLVIVVLGRTCQVADDGDGELQIVLTATGRKDRFAEFVVRQAGVERHSAGVT